MKKFYQVWNGVKQPDLSQFITKPDTNTPTIFNYTNVRNTLNKLKKSASGLCEQLRPKILYANASKRIDGPIFT